MDMGGGGDFMTRMKYILLPSDVIANIVRNLTTRNTSSNSSFQQIYLWFGSKRAKSRVFRLLAIINYKSLKYFV